VRDDADDAVDLGGDAEVVLGLDADEEFPELGGDAREGEDREVQHEGGLMGGPGVKQGEAQRHAEGDGDFAGESSGSKRFVGESL
jgi:hypothetical protein